MIRWSLDNPKIVWLLFLLAILWVVAIFHFIDKNWPKGRT